MDEEPYNLATLLGILAARAVSAPSLFFTWQNLLRRYPPPFSLMEKVVYRASAQALVGNAEAEGVLRAKGYQGGVTLIPQFGFDPDLFAPSADPRVGKSPCIGFVGRLVEEKGLLVLLEALAGLQGDWQLHVIGSGPLAEPARARAHALGLNGRVTWEKSVPSTAMPQRMRRFTLLAAPSLTRPHWKEQFGRALVEAMACEVPVVGFRSGEIPNVVEDAGVLVPEGDVGALRSSIADVLADPRRRTELGQRGRQRFLQCYTHLRIAQQTVAVYERMLSQAIRPS
jgi:glycosyltransferase involved in cell wall biosynthesis